MSAFNLPPGTLLSDLEGKEWIVCECGNPIHPESDKDYCEECLQAKKEEEGG